MSESVYAIVGQRKELTEYLNEKIPDVIEEIIDLENSFVVITSSTRGGSGEKIDLDMDNIDIVTFEFEDKGCWSLTKDEYLGKVEKRATRSSGEVVIEPYFSVGTRGGGKIKQRVITFIATRKITKKSFKKVGRWIEDRIENNLGLFKVERDFALVDIDVNEKGKLKEVDKPYLLLLHGTASSFEGSFSGMKGTPEWDELYDKYGDRIIALNHRTITESVYDNVKKLLNYFKKKSVYEIDLLTFSRGGLVGEVLTGISSYNTSNSKELGQVLTLLSQSGDLESNDPEEDSLEINVPKNNIKIRNYTRVACPAFGTPLLSENLDEFLKLIFQSAEDFLGLDNWFGQATLVLDVLVSVFAKQKDHEDVLPGLQNMTQSSDFQMTLNSGAVVNDQLIVFAGVSKSTSLLAGSLRKLVEYWLIKGENDYVVSTDSMSKGFKRSVSPYKKRLVGTDVHHLNYFKNANSRKLIIDSLVHRSTLKVDNFELIMEGESKRGVLVGQGKTRKNPEYDGAKPVLILLPGVLGSTFDSDGDLFWIKYLKLLGGGMKKLEFGNDSSLSLSGAVGDSYNKFVEHFDHFYHVEVFPYDWRKSISDAGKILHERVKELSEISSSGISIVAHSMGGIVTRDFLFRCTAKEEKRINKIVLLGTPWLGSYLIPQMLMGENSRFDKLRLISRRSFSRNGLMDLFAKFGGAMDLLPTYNEKQNFGDSKIWKTLKSKLDHIGIPSKDEFVRYKKYEEKVKKNLDNINYDKIFYIAGKADETTDGINTEGAEVEFVTIPEGDGAVTWESGIPKPLTEKEGHVFYCDIKHGDLANKKHIFHYLHQILKGETFDSFTLRPNSDFLLKSIGKRGASQEDEGQVSRKYPYYSSPSDLMSAALFDSDTKYKATSVEASYGFRVKVLSGHLRYAEFPVLVGHFAADPIVSAEKEIDYLLNRELSIRNNLGLYPGVIGSAEIIFDEDAEDFKGTCVVGLGDLEDFNSNLLEETIEKGVLKYLIESREIRKKHPEQSGISALMIGSGYGNLGVEKSIRAIIDGVYRANKSYLNFYNDSESESATGIDTLEFIELYLHKAQTAASSLKKLAYKFEEKSILIEPKIGETEGMQEFYPYENGRDWWRKLQVEYRVNEENNRKEITYTPSSNKARVDIASNQSDITQAEEMFSTVGATTPWNDRRMLAAFSILVPPEIRDWFASNGNIELGLTEYSAKFPWEMFQLGQDAEEPYSLKHKIIRKLEVKGNKGEYHIRKPNYKRDLSITVIADPKLSTLDELKIKYPNEDFLKSDILLPLDSAAEEGRQVSDLFNSIGGDNRWKVTSLIREEPLHTRAELQLEQSRILHIASHGAYNYGLSDNGFEIIFDYNNTLSKDSIFSVEHTPQLVFLNCCHSGSIQQKSSLYDHKTLDFAASAGLAFIRKGVRAAIVTAWEVSDNVALLFARVFYTNLLKSSVVDSFHAAKREAYSQYPNDSTWAAYQLYGDPHFFLENEKKSAESDRTFNTEMDALVELESLVRVCSSARHRSHKRENLLKWIEETEDLLKSEDKFTDRTREKLANAYMDLGYTNKALVVLTDLLRDNSLNYSAKTLHSYNYMRMKQYCERISDAFPLNSYSYKKQSLVMNDGKRGRINAIVTSVDKNIIKSIKSQYVHTTFFNTSILTYQASILKSSLFVDLHRNGVGLKLENVKGKLGEVMDTYEEMFVLNNNDIEVRNSVHAISTWLILKCLSVKKVSDSDFEKAFEGLSFKEYKSLLKSDYKFSKLKTFWNDIAKINIAHSLIAESKDSEEIEKYLNFVKDSYDRAWDRGGSYLNLKSEYEFVRFVLSVNKRTDNLSKASVGAFESLYNYYLDKFSKS